jgi:hypothetical protein
MALAVALSVLLALTVPMLALLAASAFEPVIARNLVDGAQALYVAEAGMEWAITQVAVAPDGAVLLPGSASDTETAMALIPPPGLLPWGTAAITARRAEDRGTGTARSVNGVILTSTGTVNGAQRTIEVAVRASGEPGAREAQPRPLNWRER